MKQKQETVKIRFGSSLLWVWMNAGAVSIVVIMTIGLLAVIAVHGLGYFWPANVIEATYQIPDEAAKTVIGEMVQVEEVPRVRLCSAGMPVPEAGPKFMTHELLKLGNCELYGSDFSWVVGEWLQDIKRPEAPTVLERRGWGNFHGYLLSVKENGQVVVEGDAAVGELQKRMQWMDGLYAKLRKLGKGDIGGTNHGLECLCLKERKLQLDGKLDAAAQADLTAERNELQAHYKVLEEQLNGLYQEFDRDSVVTRDVSGRESKITLNKLVYAYWPSAMDLGIKVIVYFKKPWEFLSDDPREANTEGGIFPAIFGIVMMTLVVALIITPFGVIVAVYLREHAKQGPLTRVIRIAVNSPAGVPAVVYGVFGLGFFAYVLGGSIDRLFFPEALPAPIFGTPGLFWASLALAILAVSVVIVATEEGLARIPRAVREGSLAFSVAKAETLWEIILPMASPAIATGLTLAMVRAASEVAPLMLVGVVKLAPSLPVDGNYPYVYLDQEIMHLGLHIYGVGLQSPNVEAAWPLVYATVLLLVVVTTLLNFSAIAIRNRLREKYEALENRLRELPMRNETASHGINLDALGRDRQSLDLASESVELEVPGLNLLYDAKQALFDARMNTPKQRMTVLIGSSDYGKSTPLRCFNRMNDLVDGCRVEGEIRLDGHSIFARGVDVAELRHRADMVFQKPNPFPKNIHKNVVYGLRIQGINRKRVLDKAAEWVLKGTALREEVKDRLHEPALGLSDDQQQRLVIARTITVEPEVLLLDESCSALDPISTPKIEELIYESKPKLTIVIVTHNMQQAAWAPDYTAFMYMGRLIEFGDTDTLLTNPAKKRTKDYIVGRYGQRRVRRRGDTVASGALRGSLMSPVATAPEGFPI